MKILHHFGCGLIRLLGMLPLRLLTLLGYFVGLLYWQVGKRERRISLANIQLCYPNLSTKEQRRMAKNSLINTSICMIESTWVWAHKYPAIAKKVRSVENEDLVKNTVAEGRGVVLVLAHFGNWEIYPDYVGHNYKNGVALVKDTELAAFDKLLHKSRGRSGGTVAPCTREGLTGMYQLIAKGGVAAVGADQEPDRKHGCFAPFFGQQALASVLTQDIVQKTGAKAIGSTFLRLPKGRGYALKFFEIDKDIYSKDINKSTTALTRAHEQIISIQPEQYNWCYKRFRARPEGEANIY